MVDVMQSIATCTGAGHAVSASAGQGRHCVGRH